MPYSLVAIEHITDMIGKAAATPRGCFVEVGVYKGGTAWHLDKLATEQGRQCFLYDTFTGIPHKDGVDHHQIGDFGDSDFESTVKMFPDSFVIKGIFPASAWRMPPVAFVHLDCDQYRSIIESVNYLSRKMVKGGIMWFDDSPILAGAEKAVTELFGDRLELLNEKHFVIF